MPEYLVRWKFGPNSLLNNLATETPWYQQFHPNKKSAVDHYVSLLQNTMPSSAMTAEIFQMVQLVPGQEESKIVEEVIEKDPFKRNKKILKMHKDGHTRMAIAEAVDVSYSTVCSVIRDSVD